jgi:hypothetical protein
MHKGRKLATGFTLLALTGVGTIAAAAEKSPCDLLTRGELAGAGFSIRGKPQLQTISLRKGEQFAPTDIHSEVCFLPVEAAGDRYGVYISIDIFGEEISVPDLETWVKALAGDVASGSETQLGDVTCETGSYDYTEAHEGKRIGTQRYVACDALRGKRRVSLNLQAPEDKPALPSTEAVKALLDMAWRRL